MAVMTEQIARPRSTVAGSERQTGPMDVALQVVAYVVLVFVAFLMFVPFIFSVVTSLKSGREANQLLTLKSLFIPENPTFDAYRTVFDSDIERWFLNSVFVAVIWVFARAFTASTAGYAFARMDFPGKNFSSFWFSAP
jgi:multiple sugar transport system permease protein